MSDNNVLKLSQPSTFSDPLTEVLRSGARSLLARAVEAEVAAFLDGHSEARTEEGRRRLVRHGHLPEREIMTGIGPVAVRAPRVRDRTGQGADRIRFTSALLPPYARRSKSLEVLIPVLYLIRERAEAAGMPISRFVCQRAAGPERRPPPGVAPEAVLARLERIEAAVLVLAEVERQRLAERGEEEGWEAAARRVGLRLRAERPLAGDTPS